MKVSWKEILIIAFRVARLIQEAISTAENSSLSSEEKHEIVYRVVMQSIPIHLADDDRVKSQVNKLIEEHVAFNNALANVDAESNGRGIVG